MMATWISDLVQAHGQALGQAGGVVFATTFLIAAYSIYSYRITNTAYPNFPFVGKDSKTNTTWQLKMRWVREAKSLIYNTLSKVPGLQPILQQAQS